MSGPGALLFVYNADSGLFNTLADIGHKLFSPATYPCRLCAITHGYLSERAEWRAFVDSLGVPCEFLHRDQLRERFPMVSVPLPAVFRLVDGALRLCLDAAALKACADLPALMALIRGSCLGEDAGN
jgi:hypothetical protein